MEKPRLVRLTEIVTLLQSKTLITAPFLAKQFDVGVRTIYRDIRTLEQSGIPITTIEGKGYTLVAGYNLPPVMFTEEEANALVTVEKMIQGNSEVSLLENYSKAMVKIKSILRDTQKQKLETLEDRILIRHIHPAYNSKYLSEVQSATTDCNVLDIAYESAKSEKTERKINPFALYNTEGKWILIAFCHLQEFRAFRLDRMIELKITKEKFEAYNMTLEDFFKETYGKP
jgi:predicted DNA-binding transcriptional regulator YafY